MDKEKATESITFRITPTMKKQLEQRANEECRTISNIIISITTKYLEDIEKAKQILSKWGAKWHYH